MIVCRHNQVKVDLDKKEAIKALQRNTSKEEPKMLEMFKMFKCLSVGKYIRITMKGWKYDTIRTRTRLLKSAD